MFRNNLTTKVEEFIRYEPKNVREESVSDSRVQTLRQYREHLEEQLKKTDDPYICAVTHFNLAKLYDKCKHTYQKAFPDEKKPASLCSTLFSSSQPLGKNENERVRFCTLHYMHALRYFDKADVIHRMILHVNHFQAGEALLRKRSYWSTVNDLPVSLMTYMNLEKAHDDHAKKTMLSQLSTPLKVVGVAAGAWLTGGLSLSVSTLFGGVLGYKGGEAAAEALSERCSKFHNICRGG